MAAERKYITGKYEEYYNSFQGQYDSYGKSSSFVTEVNNMVSEFSNITNIMNYWSGEAKTSMEKDTISSIMANLQVTQENAQNALAPCCIAIDSLKACLDDIKLKEDEMLQYENELNDELLPKLEEVKNRLARLNRECSSLKSSLVAEKTDAAKRKNSSINSQISAKEKEISNANDEKKDLEDKIEEINQKINDLTEELNELKDEADTHIQTIENLESTLKEFSNYVSLTGTIMGVGDSSSFSKYSLEERLNYLQGIIDNYNTIYNSLNDLYQEKYGKGFSFSTEDFKNIDTIFDTFDIYWMAGVDKHNLIIDEGKDFTLFDIDKLTKVIGYFNTCGIVDKIDSYVSGKSWKESGLEQFYYDNSPNFLKINVFNENELKRRLKENYGVEEKDVRSFLKEKTAILKMTETNPGPYGRLLGEYQEYQKLKTTMAVVKEKISNLNNAKKLLPYEMEMENSDFNSYLEKDYSGYLYLDKDKLDIMSQKEIALYDYLLHNKSKSEANAYLNAMENAFNQRIGAKKAAEYIEWLKTDGFDARDLFNSGVEGVKDGVRSFGQGFVNLFKAYSIEEGEKSALDYELMYKSQYMQQLMMDPSFINQTTNDKWLGAADLNAWYNTGSSIGNMAIPALIGMIPGGQGISSVLFGASIAGNAAAEAKQNGASTLQAYVYGGITGLSESITEYTLGKIPGLSKVTEGNFLKNMLGEGFEEFVQEYMDVGVRAAVLGEKVDFGLAAANQRFNTAFEAGKQGAITSGVMNPMSNVVVKGADVAFKGVTNVTGSINLGVDPVTGKNITASTFSEYSAGKNYLKNYNKAQGIVSEVMGKVDANQQLSISDKVKLKNALETVSAQDVAEMTKDFSGDQINALKDATKGLPRVSKNISSKIDLSQTFSEVEASSDLSKVTLDKGSLKEAVTKDGRTLAEYIADEKGAALTSEARSNIESTSRNVLKKIDSRVEQNEKSINKQNTKINDAVDTVNEIADIIENNGEVTFSDKTRLSRAMDTLSTEEVSQVTRNLTKEQVEGLKHATDGVPIVGSKVSSKIETAEKINEINNSSNLSDVSLDSKTLNQKVTRDGSTLAEYIADTKADSLDTNARNNIRSVSEKAMAQIDTRIEENERVLQKQQEVLRRRAKADLMDTSAEVRENPTSAGDIQARNVADQTTSGSETQQSVRAQEQTTTKTEDHVVEAMPTMVGQAVQQQMMQEVLQEEVQEENTRDSRVRDASSIGLGLAGMLGANSGLQVESTTDSSSSERANSQIGVEERQHDSRTTTFEEERNSTETQTETRTREDIQSFDGDTKTETREEVWEDVEESSNSIQEQSSDQNTTGVVEQVESEIAGATFEDVVELTVQSSDYSDMKEIAEAFLESNSSEKAKMVGAVTIAAIQNGDVDFILSIKDRLSVSEFNQVMENIKSVNTEYANVFENINQENKKNYLNETKGSTNTEVNLNDINEEVIENNENRKPVELLFEDKMKEQNIEFSRNDDGSYVLQTEWGNSKTISKDVIDYLEQIDDGFKDNFIKFVTTDLEISNFDKVIKAIVPYFNDNVKIVDDSIIINNYGDKIQFSEFEKNNVSDKIELLSNDSYFELREKYDKEISSIDITNDGEYSIRFTDGAVIKLTKNDIENQDIYERINESRYNYRYQKVNSEIRVESKDGVQYKVVPKTELMQVQEAITQLTPKDIIMVHSTDYFPSDKVIYANTDVSTSGRNTIHFAGNGLVEGGFSGAASWENKKYIILEPAESHFDSSFRGGFLGDFYFDKPVRLQNPTLIIKQSTFEQLTFQELQGLKGYDVYVINGENVYQDVGNVIKSKGYRAVESTSIPATGIDYVGGELNKRLTAEQMQNEKAFTEMIADLNKNGITNARSRLLHAWSSEMKIEKILGDVASKLSTLRNTEVIGIGREVKTISSDEFISLIEKLSNTDRNSIFSVDNVQEVMNKYGLEYNSKTDEFTIADVDRWKRINNDASIYGDKERVRKALAAALNDLEVSKRVNIEESSISNDIQEQNSEQMTTQTREEVLESVERDEKVESKVETESEEQLLTNEEAKIVQETEIVEEDTALPSDIEEKQTDEMRVLTEADLTTEINNTSETKISENITLFKDAVGKLLDGDVALDSIERMKETIKNLTFTQEEITSLSTEELAYFLEYSSPNNGYTFATALNENDTFRKNVIEAIKANPNISIESGYEYSISTELRPEEIVENYDYLKDKITISKSILDYDIEIPGEMTKDILNKYHFILNSNSSTNIITIDSTTSEQALTHIEQMIKDDVDNKYIVGFNLENGENILKFFEKSDIDVIYHVVYNNKYTTVSKTIIKEYYSLKDEIHKLANMDSSVSIQDRIDFANQIIEKADSNSLLNLTESDYIKDCIASTLKDLIEKHGTELFQDKSVRNKLFNIYEYSVRNNLDYNYRTVILYRSPINEIIQNYSTVKYDIDSYLKTKILNSNYFVSPEIISDLIVKENNRIELSTYDSNSGETNFLDLNSNGRQRVIDILKNNPSVTYTMSKTDLRRFGLTNLDINNLNVSFAGETITYSQFKDSSQIILNIKRRINSLKNNGSYSIAEKIEDLNDILKIKNDSTSLVSKLDFVATQTDIAIIVESIFESFNENDLFNLSESDIKTLSEFKYHLGNYISQHVESWIEKGLSSNLFDLLKNNASIDLSSTAYKKLADVLNIHELLDNYDVIKRNSVFKDALIDSLLVKTDLENVLSLNDTQLINLIECSNWKGGQINIKQFELRDNIYDFISNGISSNQTFAKRIFNSIENGDISLDWNIDVFQKTIMNYNGEIPNGVLDRLISSPDSLWYAYDLNEIGKKRFVELFNSSKTKAERVIVNNFQDNIEILNNIKDGNYIVFIQNKSKVFDIKDVKNSIEALQKMDAKIKILQNDNSLNVYQDIINDISNYDAKLSDFVDFGGIFNILNDKQYSKYIDLMSDANKKIAWNLNIQKDHILDLALNGREENLVSFILSEDALLPENREIINKLRNNAKIGEGEIAGIDASKVRYTTQINPELLTDKAIARINEFIKNNPDITIALDFKNTSGLTPSMIAKFDSNVLFKIEGAYSNEFIRLRGSNTYVGSEFTSNILNRGELYAVMSKIEEIESRINPSWSEKEKAIYLYEVLKKSITYDHATCDLEDIIEKKDKNNRILGHYSYASDAIRSLRGLVSGKSVCAGYSVIYQELLNRQGIEAYYENGDAIRSDGSRGGHAWNVVVLDGKNYVCDLTWDAGNNSTSYQFTQTLEEFSKKHDRTTIYTLVPEGIYEKISTMSNEEVVETINKINSSKRTINPLKEKFKSLFRKTNTSISDDVLTTKDKYSVDKFETEQTINDVSTNNATKSSIDSIIDTELTRENQIAELLESETLIEKANHYADNEIVSEKKEEQKPILLDPPAFTMEDNKLWENYDKEKFDKTFKSVEKDGVTYYIADGEQFKFLVHVIPTNGVVKVQKLEQLQRNLATHPELFVLSDVDSGNYISCSTISSESMPTFGSALSRLTNNGSIILGFNEDDINKIYEYYDHDAGTTPGAKFNTYNETVFKLGQEKTTTEYDEVIISRDGRMPDYIISPFSPDDIERNANNVLWAKAYGIPIVYIDTQTYVNQYATEVHDIIKRLENGECLGQNEYNKLLSLSANAGEIGHLSSTYNTLFGDSSIDNNLPLLFTNAELTNLSKNFNKENIAKVFEIKNGNFILEKAISTSFSNNQSSIVYDAIIEHFELNQKYPYLSRDDFARLIKDICITPRNANDPLSFEFILDSLERNKMDIQKVSEILRNIENGIIINRNDVALLEENRYFKVLNDGDMKALFNKELEKVLQNPTKSNVENLYTINYYGAAESTIYDLYIRNSLSGNSSSSVFDILILKYNLEERYPNLTKNEIINKLIEFASISRDNYSTTFGFELSKLDEYAHSISNSSTDATVLQGSADTSSSNIEDSSEIIADDVVFESIETFDDVDAEVSQLKDISLVIDEICKKNNCSQEKAISIIEKVINTGVYSYVTRDGGARGVLQQYSTSELRNILDNYKSMESVNSIDVQRVENAIGALMEKYNMTREHAIEQVNKAVDTGNMNYITNYKDARKNLSLSSIEQIKDALNKIENNNYRKSHSTYRGIVDIKFEKRNLEKSFEKIGDKNNSSYGVDQGLFRKMFNIYDSITGQRIDYRDAIEIKNKARENHEVLPKFRKQCSNEYFDFREKVAAKYGISEKDASIIMESIDDKGACSYASVCNEIFSAFLNHEVEFERLFGFPMYKKTNGIISFNSEELLFDIYLNANTDVNGGRFFIRDRNGYRININAFSSKVDPLGRSLLDSKEQQYLSTTKGKNTILINNYLKTKGLYFDSAVLKARNAIITDSQMNGLIKHVAEGINSGKTYSLGIYSRGNEINFYAPRGANYGSMSTTKWHEGGGHSVFVVGVNEEGFTVSSWGKKYLITFNDLMNGGSWLITEDSISPAANQNNRNNQNSYPVMDSKNKRKIAFNDSEIVDDFSVVDDIDNAPSQFNLDSKTEILKIDEKSIIDKMKEKKLPKKDVIKFQSLLKNAKEIVARDNFKHYNKNLSKTEIISSFAKEFGDAGKKVNLLLQKGKSLSEIRQIMINDGEDVSEFDEFVNETISGRFLSTLNSRQLSALRQFTGAGLHKINNTIRNLRENSSYMFVVDDIYESLSNAPSLGCDLLVYRGTDISALTSDKIINQLLKGVNMSDNNELYIALKNVVGLSIRDLGFLSTSPGYKTSFAPRENKNIVFEIIVPDGTKGAYINQLSEFYNEENEYLLSYGTTLRILNIMYSIEKKIIIQCIVESQLTPSN